MLEELLNHIHNRFDYKYVLGTFTIENGGLEIDGLQQDQYFWVTGSVFNDGLHQYPEYSMRDETFDGKIRFLAVPLAVVELAEEIEKWRAENSAALDSPYQSESFDGYTYTKASGQSDGSGAATWQSHFATRLNDFRKVSW